MGVIAQAVKCLHISMGPEFDLQNTREKAKCALVIPILRRQKQAKH